MRIIRKDDISKSEKLAIELKRLLSDGREERDKKIFEIEEELLKLKPLWDSNFFVGRNVELTKIQKLITERKTEKFIVASQWNTKVNQVLGDLERINSIYTSEILGELGLALRRIEKFFDYSFDEKFYNRQKDAFTYRFMTNLTQINEAEDRLLKARSKILDGKAKLSLKEILSIFDEVLLSIPNEFLLTEEILAGAETLADFRARREMGNEKFLFENSQEFVSFASPSILGPTLGKLQPLMDYWKVKPKGGK